MLKFLIITFLVIFVLIRVGGFIYKTLFWMLGARAGNRNMYRHNGQRPQQRRTAGDINIDYIPENDTKQKRAGFNGGEYVDYEEVK
jgi:hypothetical protein